MIEQAFEKKKIHASKRSLLGIASPSARNDYKSKNDEDYLRLTFWESPLFFSYESYYPPGWNTPVLFKGFL